MAACVWPRFLAQVRLFMRPCKRSRVNLVASQMAGGEPADVEAQMEAWAAHVMLFDSVQRQCSSGLQFYRASLGLWRALRGSHRMEVPCSCGIVLALAVRSSLP